MRETATSTSSPGSELILRVEIDDGRTEIDNAFENDDQHQRSALTIAAISSDNGFVFFVTLVPQGRFGICL